MLTFASNLFNLVFSSDPFGIGVITLLLITLFFVAWKAPAWVKETGLVALATGWLWTVCEFMAVAKAIVECEPDVDMYIVWAAVPSALIPAAYGLVVYIISLIIRIVLGCLHHFTDHPYCTEAEDVESKPGSGFP